MSHVRATSAGCIAAGLVVLALFLAACSPTESMMGSPSTSPTTSPADSRSAYANANILANPDWLAELLTDPKMRVVALVPRADYQRGHIPGAVQIDWPDLQVTDTSDPSIERWRGEVEQKLGGLGISFDDTVVIYDHGILLAARLWWVLDQLGHRDKRVLNGGLPAWRASGKETTGEDVTVQKVTYSGQPDASRIASWQYVLDRLGDPKVQLVDARTPEEYRGENTSGAQRGGHIPGAVNVNYVENAQPNEPRYFKSQAELEQLYAGLGVTKDKEVIPYCTTGVRSAVTYFTLKLIGYPDVRLYTGSWAEWGNRGDLPIERGSSRP